MKSKTIKNAIIISSVYVGTVLGAGFASGQEMMKFFAYYGCKGMFGLLLTGMLFGIIGYMVLKIIYIHKCKSYVEFMNLVVGNNIRGYIDIIVILFMFVCFCAMFAGCGALFEQRFNMSYYQGVLLIATACFLTFLFEVKGIVTINTVLAPLLLIGTIIIGVYIWYDHTLIPASSLMQPWSGIQNNWIISSVIYVAYNCITAIVVLGSLGKLLNKHSTVILSSVFGGLSLGVIGLILGVVVLIYYNDIVHTEIPLLAVVMNYTEFIQVIYILLLISAMFTTAVANGFGLIDIIKERSQYLKEHKGIINIFVVMSAAAFSSIGFSNMVGKVYPVFGYLGLFQLICIMLYYLKYKKIE
jgi:uncharacterized membrane protein YkvI